MSSAVDPAEQFRRDLEHALDLAAGGGLARLLHRLADDAKTLPPAAVAGVLDVLRDKARCEGRVEDWAHQVSRWAAAWLARVADGASAPLARLTGTLADRLDEPAARVGSDPWLALSDWPAGAVTVQSVSPFVDGQLVAPLNVLPADHPARALADVGFAHPSARGPCVVLGAHGTRPPVLVRLSDARRLTGIAQQDILHRHREAARLETIRAQQERERMESDPLFLAARRAVEEQLAAVHQGEA